MRSSMISSTMISGRLDCDMATGGVIVAALLAAVAVCDRQERQRRWWRGGRLKGQWSERCSYVCVM